MAAVLKKNLFKRTNKKIQNRLNHSTEQKNCNFFSLCQRHWLWTQSFEYLLTFNSLIIYLYFLFYF